MWDWTIKKAEHRRIDAVKLWCWGILLRVLWTARRSSLSILKEFRSGYSLEGLMLKLKLQYFGHLMWRADSFEKTLMLGKIEGRRSRRTTEDEMVGWHHHLNGHGFVWTLGVGNGQGGLACCCSWGCKHSDSTERLNWRNYFELVLTTLSSHWGNHRHHFTNEGPSFQGHTALLCHHLVAKDRGLTLRSFPSQLYILLSGIYLYYLSSVPNIFLIRLFLYPLLSPISPCTHLYHDDILPVKMDEIILQLVHFIFMSRTATGNICT